MGFLTNLVGSDSGTEDDATSQQAAELVEAADHETVTVKRLTKVNGTVAHGYLNDRAVIDSLAVDDGEQSVFIFTSDREAIAIEPSAEEHGVSVIVPDMNTSTFAVVTDERILILADHKQRKGDDYKEVTLSIPYSAIVDVDAEEGSGIRGGPARLGTLVVQTHEATFYLPVKATGFSTESPVDAVEYIEQRMDAHRGRDGEPSIVSFETVCYECRQSVSPKARRCPHCQYAPEEKRRGGLYWGTSTALTLTVGPLTAPIGAYGLYKGKKRKEVADAGVAETVVHPSSDGV